MAIKLSAAERKQKEDFADKWAEARDAALEAYTKYREACIEAYETHLNEPLTKLEALVQELDEFRAEVADRIHGEMSEKSERWQDSEAGQAADSFHSEWDNAELIFDRADDECLREPELPEEPLIPDLGETLNDLPDAP